MSSITTQVAQLGYTARKVDSTWKPRLTAAQEAIIVANMPDLTPEDVATYVASGDLSDLDKTVHATLTACVKACKEGLTESQAKRFWPRKVASVILTEKSSR